MAARYWSGKMTGSSLDWNYNTGGTNWGSASGVADDASIPTTTDDVYFDGAGTNGNTNSTISATISVLSLTITSGYTATMTHNAQLTINGATWTMHSGYTISGTGIVRLSTSGTITITSGGKTWPNDLQSVSNAKTITLVGNFNVAGLLTAGSSGAITVNKTTAETFTASGGLRQESNGRVEGNTGIILAGGTWSASGSNAYILTNLNFAGNVTISGNVYFSGTGGYIITYDSGTITTTSSTLNMLNVAIFDTDGMTWNNITLSGSGNTYTINSTLNISGTLDLGAASIQTFDGTHGFYVNDISNTAVGSVTVTMEEAVEYIIYGSFLFNKSVVGSGGIGVLFTSADGTVKTKITIVNNGTSSCNTNAAFRRVDASAGRSVTTFGGTITDCINVIQYYDYPPVAL